MARIKVVATARGYDGQLREVGDQFEVDEDRKATWYRAVEEAQPRRGRPPKSKDDGETPPSGDLAG